MKRRCAKEAVSWAAGKEIIGLGGGQTIGYLAEYLKEAGFEGQIVTPSKQTKEVCEHLGLPVTETKEVSHVDIAFDGCDQVDRCLNAIKSGGGIHTKEKIIGKMADEYVLLVDESKVAEQIDFTFPIVLEIVPEAKGYVESKIQEIGGRTSMKSRTLMEVWFAEQKELESLDRELKQMTGVVETSLFYHVAAKAIVAGEQGITVMEAERRNK